MYIPYELVWFLLGFIAFPIFIYALWEFMLKKKEEKYEKKNRGNNI